MEDFFCKECGAAIPHGVAACPNCGFPIKIDEQAASDIPTDTPPHAKANQPAQSHLIMKRKSGWTLNFPAVISLILGLVIIFIGANLSKTAPNTSAFHFGNYNVEYAAFGGDFYTEIHGAVRTVSQELSSIGNGLSELSDSVNCTVECINHACGLVVVAIGLATVAISLTHLLYKKS